MQQDDASQRYTVRLIEAFQDENFIFIVMEYCAGGDLFSLLYNQPGNRLPENTARRVFKQILACLHYLQSMGLCHGDLSPENIMWRDEDQTELCLIDFESCLQVPRLNGDVNQRLLLNARPSAFKLAYAAPELVHNAVHGGTVALDGFAIDLWSAGAILYEMLTGEKYTPFGVAHVYPNLSLPAKDLLTKMLAPSPQDRLTLAEVRSHSWMMLDD